MAKVTITLEDDGSSYRITIENDPPTKPGVYLTLAQQAAVECIKGLAANGSRSESQRRRESYDEDIGRQRETR